MVKTARSVSEKTIPKPPRRGRYTVGGRETKRGCGGAVQGKERACPDSIASAVERKKHGGGVGTKWE
jgi:hypothetical protein